jgi:ABC-type transporter Mla subunit MlaD
VERTVTEINMKGNNLVQVLDVAENVADMQDKVLQVIERQGQSVSAQSREVLAIFQTAQNAAMDAQNQLFSRLEANTEAVLQTMESAARLSESLDKVIDRLWAGNELSEQLAVTVEQCQYDSNKTIEMLGAVITPVASLLSDSKVQNQQLITVLTANQQATRELFDRIGRSTQASEALMPQTIEKVEQGNAALHSQLVNIVSLLSRQAVANDSARVVALPAPAEKA